MLYHNIQHNLKIIISNKLYIILSKRKKKQFRSKPKPCSNHLSPLPLQTKPNATAEQRHRAMI